MKAKIVKTIEYIREDNVDSMLETAEDRAYFADSENTREKLKEEANRGYNRGYVAGYKAAKEECIEPYQLGFKNGKERTIDKVCEWLETNYTEFLDGSRLGINTEELIKDLKNDFKTE